MRLNSLTHQAEQSERVIEGKPKAKLCFVYFLYNSLTSVLGWKLALECDEVESSE